MRKFENGKHIYVCVSYGKNMRNLGKTIKKLQKCPFFTIFLISYIQILIYFCRCELNQQQDITKKSMTFTTGSLFSSSIASSAFLVPCSFQISAYVKNLHSPSHVTSVSRVVGMYGM